MPDLDLDNGGDPQDEAETFDETNREDELAAADGDFEDNPDLAGDVYDATSALGDADADDGAQYALGAADFGPDDIDGDDLEDDEDEDDNLDDDPEDDDLDDDDDAIDAAAGRSHAGEPGLSYVADVDASTDPRDDGVEKYESTHELSDAQLTTLGYRDDDKKDQAMDDKTHEQDKARPQLREERTFAEELVVIRGTGASADDVEDESDIDDENRLDEGLEETFPASDPVSAKHIT